MIGQTPETLLKQTKQERDEFVNALREVMRTRAGRKVVYRMLTICRIFLPCFTKSSETFYNEGRREVGLELLSFVSTYCRKDYRTMEDEALEDQVRIQNG